jgi:hypothetical protein
MIYVYAVADRPERPLPRQSGLRGEELSKIVWHDIAAVVSAYDGAAPSQGADEVWRHETVIESLMRDCTVVPMRFGTLAPSHRHVEDILCRTYRALTEDLARVRGQVEIGLRCASMVTEDAEDAECDCRPADHALMGPGPGSVYLRARVAKERHSRERQSSKLRLLRDVYDKLASHAHDSRLDDRPEDRHGIAAAFLLPRDRMTAFQEIVSGVAAANPDLALLCTGPWPPYSFVGAGSHATNLSETRHAS